MTRRSVPMWEGKTPETAAPPRVKARIVERQEGICACGCGQKLGMAAEPIEFDHEKALINGGTNDEQNLRALRRPCHAFKTKADVAEKAKVDRVRKKHLNLVEKKSQFPGSKRSKWKRKVSGEVVRRDET